MTGGQSWSPEPGGAKWAFTTRRVPVGRAAGLSPAVETARSGDLVLAVVERLGCHKRLQTREGRFSALFPGDRVVVACGDRFATDQFEGRAELRAKGCDLLAGGGVAGIATARHAKAGAPTKLRPVGLLTDAAGRVISLADHALPPRPRGARPGLTLGVVGSGMNAGKTDATAWAIHGMALAGRRTAGIKLTGTGSFGDVQTYADAGAALTLDFTDAGMAATFRQDPARLLTACDLLLAEAAAQGCDTALVELADGVTQVETAALLSDPSFVARFDGFLFAAADPLAAMAGVSWLADRGAPVLALTGLMCAAPLAVAEVERWSAVPVLPREALADPATASALALAALDRSRPALGSAA
jgi:hypothetical protein